MIPLITRAADFTDRIAIVSNGNAYSYNDLLTSSRSVSAHLLSPKSDLKEEPVAFMVPPSFEYTAVQWGIWQAGGIAVPLCVLHPLPSLKHVLEDTECNVLIVHKDYYDMLRPLAHEMKMILFQLSDVLQPKLGQIPDISMQRRAMILYTSGTTSLPKGVVTTHANIDFQITSLIQAWNWSKDDRILNILPMHHVHGIINIMSCALYAGACCEFLSKFNAKKVWEVFIEGSINLFMAVPTIYYKLIEFWAQSNQEEKNKMSSSLKTFRLMVSGSAALPVPVLERWKTISGHTLLERYGMTEIGMALSNPYSGERRPGHVGKALPGVEIELFHQDGQRVEPGQAGEIHIKSDGVFLEYWKNKKACVEAFTSEGWFKTGDIAELNDGYYKILGRNSVDIIKSGGYKISALEIEDRLRTHPKINDCAVVGLEDDEWGEVIAAALLTSSTEIDFELLNEWLVDRLPKYKIPRKYIIMKDLPRNALGKVTKNELKQSFIDHS